VSAKNAASLFSKIFVHLAQHGYAVPPARTMVVHRDEFARWLWRLTERYDFHPADMDCSEALEKLGLARRHPPAGAGEQGPAYDPDWIYTEDE
jgi:hypothetical protein